MSNITASLDELLSPCVLRVRDLDPAILLAGVTFARMFFATLKPDEMEEVRRRARRDHPVERALLHLLPIESMVRRGAFTWDDVERYLHAMVERQDAN